MIVDIFTKSNFLDLLIVILVVRICYIAAKLGLGIEIFKFFGVIFSTYIALHYYVSLSDSIRRGVIPKGTPLEFIDFLSFVFLAGISYLAFVALRSMLYRFVQLEALPEVSRYGGLFFGFLRSIFVVGILVYALSISSIKYFTSAVENSYLGSRSFSIAPNTYKWIWNSLVSKFSAKEQYNSTIDEVIERFNTK